MWRSQPGSSVAANPSDPAADGQWLSLGVYNVSDGQRLPLVGPTQPSGAPQDGAHALILGPVRLD